MGLNRRLNSQIRQLPEADRLKLIGLIAFEFDIFPLDAPEDTIMPKMTDAEYIAAMAELDRESQPVWFAGAAGIIGIILVIGTILSLLAAYHA